jgi:hypothetical protein
MDQQTPLGMNNGQAEAEKTSHQPRLVQGVRNLRGALP